MKALIVVDMQYDFISGSLAVPGATEIIVPIQERLLEVVNDPNSTAVFTACDHPPDHCSFIENGGQWPRHCVTRTHGAKVQVGLAMIAASFGFRVIYKGRDKRVDEYSGFAPPLLDGTGSLLDRMLRARGVEEVEVCGLARNYCVEATAEAARAFGYKVTVLEELCRAV